jgi:hypothetical protein
MPSNQVIVLEFNELTPTLMDKFIANGWLPNFQRFRQESCAFTSIAAEREPYLEPWIQWVTVHTGLNYAEHKVFHLNEGHGLDRPRTWELAADAGMKTWVCGSMNVRQPKSLNCQVLPDPWCTKVKPTPTDLEPFFKFVQQNVLEHTNEGRALSRKDYLSFLRFMALHGLSTTTVRKLASQLLDERRTGDRWKRVALLDRLQLDVFKYQFERHRPDLSTFFLNSTAHYQHAYWDSMEPEAFTHQPAASTRAQFEKAILYGYQQMDVILADFLSFAGNDKTLVLTTALSQQPAGEAATVYYRPRDFSQLNHLAGLGPTVRATPVMTQQFYLEFDSSDAARDAYRQLNRITIDGQPLLEMRLEGPRIFAGCARYDVVNDSAQVDFGDRRLPFYDVFYALSTGKSGIHHPHGLFWIRTPLRKHVVQEEPVPLAAVAPTVLALLGVSIPSYMESPVPASRMTAGIGVPG